MKKNMKLKITALVAMLFMALAVTFLSFSHADEEAQDESLLMAKAPFLSLAKICISDIIIRRAA